MGFDRGSSSRSSGLFETKALAGPSVVISQKMSSSAKDTSKVADKKIVAKVDADAKAKPKSTLELLEEDDEFEEFDGKWH